MKAIIVDLDGTFVDNQWRCRTYEAMTSEAKNKLDWETEIANTIGDPAAPWCREIIDGMVAKGYHIIFITGRTDAPRAKLATEQWLSMNLSSYTSYELHMRKHNDLRPDFVVKREIYQNNIICKYDILFAIDDRREVIDMWTNIGIPSLHCSEY